MRTQGQPNIQGYNAQAVGDRAADHHRRGDHDPVTGLRAARTDGHAALRELERAGVSERPRTVLADAGYWHRNQIEHLLADGFQVLVPPDSMIRDGARPGWEGGMYAFMRRVLATDLGRELYIKRRHSIEPVFGQIKHNRGMTAVPTTRQGRRAVGMAPDRSHPQPPQAPQPLDRARHRVNQRPRARLSAQPPLTVRPLSDSLVRKRPRRQGERDDCSVTDGAVRRRPRHAAAARPLGKRAAASRRSCVSSRRLCGAHNSAIGGRSRAFSRRGYRNRGEPVVRRPTEAIARRPTATSRGSTCASSGPCSRPPAHGRTAECVALQ